MESNKTPSHPTNDDGGDSPPRQLPAAEAEVYGDDVLLEEETLSWFHPDKWYPVRIGEVIHSRYQVLVKLGFGSVSTVWLCRDLRRHIYVTLKVYETGHRQAANESNVLRHLRSLTSNRDGRNLVRTFRNSFEISGPIGLHVCLVYDPLCMSLEDLRLCAGGKLPKDLLKPIIRTILRGLNYLHAVGHVVHTDLQAGNIMMSTDNLQVWDDLVAEEWATPTPRKIASDRIIYESRSLDIPDDGVPVICDFGEAKVGDGPFTGEVMPDLYRAPEIILCVPWTEKIDIWSLGLMIWDLFEGKHLFNKRLPSREATRGVHLARIVSLLGKPPKDFLERSEHSSDFFDDDGDLKLDPGGMEGGSIEEEEENLEGDDKEEFLSFVGKMLQWRPEDRPTAYDLMENPWLNSR